MGASVAGLVAFLLAFNLTLLAALHLSGGLGVEDALANLAPPAAPAPALSPLPPRTPRLMCLVLSQLSAESAAKRAAVEDTWGRDCDVLRFVVSSPNASGADPAQGLAGTPHGDRFIVLPRAAKEDRIALFANVRAALLLAARQYASVADWFLKLDDDSLLLAGNFRAYVRGHFPDPGVPRYVGRRLKFAGMPAHHYNTGSGYALNRAALREFAAAVAQGHHSCLQHGFEDVLVARCLAQRGILPEDTRDAMGRERFSYLRPDELFDGKLIATLKWYRLQSYNLEPGEGCCSMEPVLFHRLEPRLMRVTYFLLRTRVVED